ncbi:hypothetical protein CEXT_354651 [Caerostris extrusa]|uniref:Uncharacterized protein n=1 Tax=Caerostris extrusa TaxID=172846 RepID=A0AAV4N792_CAEEX|nr:hypothetical protein CEXT_354651 [Caerostris extrusa]
MYPQRKENRTRVHEKGWAKNELDIFRRYKYLPQSDAARRDDHMGAYRYTLSMPYVYPKEGNAISLCKRKGLYIPEEKYVELVLDLSLGSIFFRREVVLKRNVLKNGRDKAGIGF